LVLGERSQSITVATLGGGELTVGTGAIQVDAPTTRDAEVAMKMLGPVFVGKFSRA
jgi:hypothetical protein